jgi:hypothetical protein
MSKNILDGASELSSLLGHEEVALIIDGINAVNKAIAPVLKKWMEWQTTSYDVARNVGMTAEQAEDLNDALRETTNKMAMMYGLSHKAFVEMQADFSNATRSARMLNEEQMHFAASMKKVGVDIKSIATSFENIGAGMETAGAYFALTQERAMKFGLNAKQATEAFQKNLEKSQQYGFKEGVNGLSKMTMLAQKLHLEMSSIERVADSFSKLEDATSAAAKLQVLGGSYAAQFSNPLEVMTQSLTDMEGFTKRVTDTFAAKGTLQKDGTVSFSPADRAMFKAASEALGMGVDEIYKLATAQVTNAEVAKQVNKGAGFTEDQLSTIQNMATFNADTGKYQVSYLSGGEVKQINVEDITQSTLTAIAPYADTEKGIATDVSDIAGNVRELMGRTRDRVSSTTDLDSKMQGYGESWWATFTGGITDSFMELMNKFPRLSYFGKKLFGFKDGGFVPGTSYTGDKQIVAVNSGELILNKDQQSNLLNQIPSKHKFASGGIVDGDNEALFALANSNKKPQESSINNLAQTAILAYAGRRTLEDGRIIRSLNQAGEKFVSNVSKSSNELTKTIGKIGDSKYINSLNAAQKNLFENFAKTNIGQTRIGQTIGAIGKYEYTTKLGRSSRFGKTIGLSKYVRQGEWGTAIERGFNQIGPGRFARYVDTFMEGRMKTLYKVSQANRTYGELKGIWNPLNESAKETASSLTRVGRTAKNSARAISNVAKTTIGGASKIAKSTTSSIGGVLGKVGVKGATKAIPMIGTALTLATSGYDLLNTAKGYENQKASILNDTTLSDDEKRTAIATAKATRNENIGSIAGGAVGATVGMALGSMIPIPVLGTALGGVVGNIVGEKIGGFVGRQWETIFGKSEEDQLTQEDLMQRQYEGVKFGQEALQNAMGDGSGESIKILAAQATVKMHDVLVSMWNNMNGKLDNGEERDEGILGGLFSSKPSVISKSKRSDIVPMPVTSTPLYNSPTVVSPYQEEKFQKAVNVDKPEININLNGTLTLKSDKQTADFDIKKLLDNPEFVRQIQDAVLEGMQRNYGGGTRNLNSVAAQMGYGV